MKKFHLIRLAVFLITTIALAKFFEAGRLIATEQTFAHVPSSIFSLFTFLFSLFILGYWVYVDEKEKNNLKHKFGLYEWIHNVIARSETTKQSPLIYGRRLLRRLFEPPRNDIHEVQK